MPLPLEKIALGCGAVIFLATAVVGLTGGRASGDIIGSLTPPNNPYEEAMLPEATLRTVPFEAFPVQRGESGWEFALFTPPNVWYDPDNDLLIPFPPVVRPDNEDEEEETIIDPGPQPIPFGVVFIGIEEMPFPISLDGYIGEEGEFYVTLRNLESNQTFLSAPGRNHPEHGIRVVDFRVLRRDIEGVRFTEGEVTLVHLESGNEIVLLQGQRVGSGDYRALFISPNEPDERIRLIPGSDYVEGEVTFTLVQMNRETNEVVVRRNEPGRTTPLELSLQINEEQMILPPVEETPETTDEEDIPEDTSEEETE